MLDLTMNIGDIMVAVTAAVSIMGAYVGLRTRLQVFEQKVTELVMTVQQHDRLLHQILGQQQAIMGHAAPPPRPRTMPGAD